MLTGGFFGKRRRQLSWPLTDKLDSELWRSREVPFWYNSMSKVAGAWRCMRLQEGQGFQWSFSRRFM